MFFVKAAKFVYILENILKNITEIVYLKDPILATSHIIVLNPIYTFYYYTYRTNC